MLKPSSVADGSRRIVYLLKIGAKSFRDGSQDICKDTESNLGPFAGFKAAIGCLHLSLVVKTAKRGH